MLAAGPERDIQTLQGVDFPGGRAVVAGKVCRGARAGGDGRGSGPGAVVRAGAFGPRLPCLFSRHLADCIFFFSLLKPCAQEVESHDGGGDAQYRRKIPPPIAIDQPGPVENFMEHGAPGDLAGIPQPQETDPGFGEHGTGHGQGGSGGHQFAGVGKDVPENDMAVFLPPG